MEDYMRRRDFITLLGGTAAAWPLAARAQQSGQMRRIGVLMGNADDREGRASINGFRQGLHDLGWIDGGNILIEERWAAGDTEKMRAAATELVGRKSDVILVRGSRALMAVQRATASIPTVFVGLSDPVGLGFIKSMARPGGHITGFTVFEVTAVGKLLELLKQIAPDTSRVMLMFHPDNPSAAGYQKSFETAAASLGVKIAIALVQNSGDIERATEAFAREPNGGLIAAPDVFLTSNGDLVVALADRYRLPAAYPYRDFVPGGGLLVYCADMPDLFRRVAQYVDRILRGERTSELPVQAPTKFEMIINLKTAKALGLTIPESFLLRADEVIE
jgi:putative ABC transport system substrate-binding protein